MSVSRIFPFIGWFKGYTKVTLRSDLISGITVALVLIPQSMAYAQLAGLPAYYGLYAAFLPPMVASLFGSSHQLATGPVAVVSLMTAATLEPLATAGGTEYVAYAILLALLVGVFQLALGLLRLGLIVNFLSHPVVNGFTNAAALIIATSQISKIFGVQVDKADHHYETIWRVLSAAFDFTHWPTLGMAMLSFAVMIGFRKLDRRIPNVLAAVVVTILLSWMIGFEKNQAVPVSMIESSRVTNLVADYNQAIDQRIRLESLRTQANRVMAKQQKGNIGKTICKQCHIHRDFDSLTEEADGLRRSGSSLELHQMAGLLDQRIAQIKKITSQHRQNLRAMQFAAVQQANADNRFLQLDAFEGKAADEAFRIKVGNQKLDPGAITMVGGGAVVATIPRGLPSLALPYLDWEVIPRLFLMAMIISLLGFMEAISIAKAMATHTHQKLDPNQELIGQGLANMIGCIGQSYAVSGSFSRSAVNLQAGARTGLSNVFSSGVVVVVLLFLTPLLYHLPQAVLASIIMMAVFGLLNVRGFVHAWKAQRFDGITGVVSFVGTLYFAPHLEYGIFMGVALSLGAYLYRTMRPHMAELSLHQDGSLRDAKRHDLHQCKHIAAIRFDGPLNFANVSYLEDEVLQVVADMPELKHVFIAAHGINEIDASGEEMFSSLVDRLRREGYEVSLSGLKDKVVDAMKRTHLYEKIGEENMYPTQLLGISSIYAKTHSDSDEQDCPLESMRPHVAELSLHPDGSLRDAKRHNLMVCNHITALRFDSPLNMASSPYLENKIREKVYSMPDLKYVIIAAHAINDVDHYGVETLRQLVEWLRSSGYKIVFSGFKENVLDTLKQTLIYDVIGSENMFPTQMHAVRGVYREAHQGFDELPCPLMEVVPRHIEKA